MGAFEEKILRAEKRLSGIRLLVIGAASLTFPFFRDTPGSLHTLAIAMLAATWIYSVAIFLLEPFRRFPVRLSSAFTTVADGALTMLWLYVTGGVASPYFVVLYPVVISVALRYPPKQTLLAAIFYGGGYLAMASAAGQTSAEVLIRVTYVFIAALIASLISREVLEQAAARASLEERAQGETAHQRAAAQLAEAQSVAHVGSWEWDVQNDRLTFSEEMMRILGFEPGAATTSFESLLSLVHEDDREKAREQILGAIRAGRSFDVEYRVRRADGRVRVLHGRGRPLDALGSKVTRATGTAQDVTDRAEILEQLRAARARLEKLVEERTQQLSASQEIVAEERASAEEAQRLLADVGAVLASSLDLSASLRQLAEVLVPRLADWCAVEIGPCDASSGQVAIAHRDPDRRDSAKELRQLWASEPATRSTINTFLDPNRPILIAETERARVMSASASPMLAALIDRVGLQSAMRVPLLRKGLPFGSIILVSAEPKKPFDPTDLALAEEIARRAALAFENVRLYELERSARAASDQAVERAVRLQTLTAHLSRAASPADVTDAALRQGMAAIGAESSMLALLSENGTEIGVVGAVGYPSALIERLQRVPIDAPFPLCHAIRSGEPVLLESRSVRKEQYPAAPSATGEGALIAVPLEVEGRVIGGIVYQFTAERIFGRDDRMFFSVLASHCAQALDRARLLERERKALEQAREAIGARDEFLSIASHELRTPISVLVLHFAGLRRLLRLPDPREIVARASTSIERAARQTDRLAKLIDSLLDVSRITSRGLHIQREPFDLAEVVRDVSERFSEELRQASCRLALNAAVPVFGSWDRLRIEQILTNLLSNAIKYGPGKPIEVTVEADPIAARVIVRDFGIGISLEDQGRIFGRYERAVPVRHYGGLGLGLYIARQIAEAHGGSIRVASMPEAGSTFTVELPREGVPGKEDAPADRPRPGVS